MKITPSLLTALLLAPLAALHAVEVRELRCEYRENPLGVDAAKPRLSWIIGERGRKTDVRGQKQTAYQVLVASTPELLAKDKGDLWDSGKVASDQSILVEYAGKPLESFQHCFWKVRVWDKDGAGSAWSAAAMWTMGLLTPEAWNARWIGAVATAGQTSSVIQLRKEFALEKGVKRAVVSVCGLGFYELRLNGQKVGDRVLDPGWTNYRKTCLYSTYDVTGQLTGGRNALGVTLGNGMYNVAGGRYVKFTGSFGPPKVILHLLVEHPDGTSTVVVSDGSWTWSPSPVVFSCIYGGEDYDARRELPGWDEPGYEAGAFKPVALVDGPGGQLAAQAAPPVKVMKEYKPVNVTQPKPGVRVYDFGQNCASMPKLTVKGPAGACVRLTPGELLQDDGLVSQASSGGPSYYTYTLKGAETETWTPRFFYYGSRYLQVETSGHDAGSAPQIVELTSQFVHSSAATVGSFACANPLVNRVHALIGAAIESNLQSVLTDCPHREKLGWLECAHLLAGCVMYNYDVPTFYAKIANDMSEAQLANGMVPDIAPEFTVFRDGFRDSPEWGSAYVITPWQVYQMYGDRSVLARHYEGMKRYVEYLKSMAKENIVSHGLGDWYDIGPGQPGESKLTSKGLTATAIYYQDLVILKEAAALLGQTDEARQFEDEARTVKDAFNRKFFNADRNQYDRNSQTANAMPLVLGLVPDDRRAAVLDGLVAQIRAGGNRVTAGDVGFNYLMRALSDGGRGDVLYDMLVRDDGPGYAYQLKMGATSLTEAWDTNPKSSQNHCMLGHIEEWFYRGLGGISPDPAGPGFKKIVIKPQIVGDLRGADVAYDSPYGRIVSNWKREGNGLTMAVTIPANATATVYIPAKEAAGVTESGKPITEAEGVKFLRMERGAAVCAVGSGTYRFQSPSIATVPAHIYEAPRVQIDWPAFLAKQDPVWEQMPQDHDDGGQVGNGVVGMTVYQSGTNNFLRFDVGRADVVDNRPFEEIPQSRARGRLPIGRFELHPSGVIKSGTLRTDLWNAELRGTVETDKGTIGFRALAHAASFDDPYNPSNTPGRRQPVVFVSFETAGQEKDFRWEWIPEKATCYPVRNKSTPKNYKPNPSHIMRVLKDVSACEQPLLLGGAYATAWKEMRTAAGSRNVFVSVGTSPVNGMALEDVAKSVREAAAGDPGAFVAGHRAWWHAYYPQSFVSLPSGRLENYYWLQIYRLGSATRGNGVVPDTQGPWYRTSSWGMWWWDYNNETTYMPVYAANRLDLGMSLIKFMDRNTNNFVLNVKPEFQHDSAGLGPNSGLDGRSGIALNGGQSWAGCLPWICHNYWLQYRYSMDPELLKRLFPLLKRSINYYRHIMVRGPDGKLHLPVTTSPEYGQGVDCTFDLAHFRWGCQTLIEMSRLMGVNDPLLPEWKMILADLTDYPMDKNGYMVAADIPFEITHRHWSHLQMVFPLYILNWDQEGKRDLISNSINHWLTVGEGSGIKAVENRNAKLKRPSSIFFKNGLGYLAGWSFYAASSMYASMGDGENACLSLLKYLNGDEVKKDVHRRGITPNGSYLEGQPVFEAGVCGVASIHNMFLQSWGDKIRVFGAMPKVWTEAVFHDLRAEGAFLVGAEWKDGKTEWLRIRSLAGEPCRVATDLADSFVLSSTQPDCAAKKIVDGLLEINLAKGQELLLRRTATVVPQVTPLPAGDGVSNFYGVK
jgi:alpha-L-rhamnosidase